jgi:ESS family glutamate:Na+ symporter
MLAMIVANILRRKIPIIMKLMIPSSVLGGFLLLMAAYIIKVITKSETTFLRDYSTTLGALTYHGLGLGFVALTLKKEKVSKAHNSDSFNAGLTVVNTYLIQGLLGLGLAIAMYYIMTASGKELADSFCASGLLVCLGFGQGPGQSYNWGSTYETEYGLANGTTLGLTYAAVGFIAASIGGIIYLNVMRRKGRLKGSADYYSVDETKQDEFIGKNEIPQSESIDKLTVQIALAFIAYILAYLFMKGIDLAVDAGLVGDPAEGFGAKTLRPLVWGFNFIFGMLGAAVVKAVMGMLHKKGWMKREYTNDFLQSRVSGFLFDMMVVASIAAIDLDAFKYTEFVIPLIVICVVAGTATYLLDDYICKNLFPDYRDEAFLALYGMLTGTASTGIILLRESDPKFETPAANILVSLQPYAIAFGFPLLLLLGVAPKSITNACITLGIISVMFVLFMFILFRSKLFGKKDKVE